MKFLQLRLFSDYVTSQDLGDVWTFYEVASHAYACSPSFAFAKLATYFTKSLAKIFAIFGRFTKSAFKPSSRALFT